MCPAFTRHTNSLSRLSYAHTYLPPPPVVSTQQHGITSHTKASSCATGAMWGTCPAKQWDGGAVWASLGVEGCHLPSVSFFFTLPISCLCMKEAICLLPVIYGCERVCDTLHFELVCHPPTSFLTHKMKPCWPSLTSPTFPRISYFQFQLFYGFAPPVFTASTRCCVIQVGMLFVRNVLLLMSGPSLAVAFLLFNLLYSVSNLKVVRARLVSSKILCTLSWFIYAINHGTWVNICAICSPASWSTAEQNHIPLFFITEATPVPLSW